MKFGTRNVLLAFALIPGSLLIGCGSAADTVKQDPGALTSNAPKLTQDQISEIHARMKANKQK